MKVSLRLIRDGDDFSHLHAEVEPNGDLVLDAFDAGPIAQLMGKDEYEYTYTIAAEHLPALRRVLGIDPDADLLTALTKQWAGRASFEMEKLIRDPSVHAVFRRE